MIIDGHSLPFGWEAAETHYLGGHRQKQEADHASGAGGDARRRRYLTSQCAPGPAGLRSGWTFGFQVDVARKVLPGVAGPLSAPSGCTACVDGVIRGVLLRDECPRLGEHLGDVGLKPVDGQLLLTLRVVVLPWPCPAQLLAQD